MRIRHVVGCVLLLTTAVAAEPADAATSGATTTTFTVSGGALSITVPASTVNLGSAAPGGTITAQLGAVAVTDARALLVAAWTGSVTATAFTTGGGTTAETVANSSVTYWSGAATGTTGTATFTPGQANAGAAQTMAVSRTAFTATAGVGDNSATWNPTLVVTLPAQAVVGTYTGTVTHSGGLSDSTSPRGSARTCADLARSQLHCRMNSRCRTAALTTSGQSPRPERRHGRRKMRS